MPSPSGSQLLGCGLDGGRIAPRATVAREKKPAFLKKERKMNPSFTTKEGLIHVDPMTPEQFSEFINALNKVAHDVATEKSRADTAEFARKLEEVEQHVRDHGQVIVERNFLEEALEASAEILERMPWVNDPDGTLIENAVEVFAKLRLMLPRDVPEEEDFDTSDNESAESAQEAKNSLEPGEGAAS